MRTRLYNLPIILSLLLGLASFTFWFLSYPISYTTGKAHVQWSKGHVDSSFFVFGASSGQFFLRFGHNTMTMYTIDSPEWPTLTPDTRQRFVRYRNDNPDRDEWIFETESRPFSASIFKDSLIHFESIQPVGLASGRFNECPMWFQVFLFAIAPALHFRKKIFKPLPAFPLIPEPLPT